MYKPENIANKPEYALVLDADLTLINIHTQTKLSELQYICLNINDSIQIEKDKIEEVKNYIQKETKLNVEDKGKFIEQLKRALALNIPVVIATYSSDEVVRIFLETHLKDDLTKDELNKIGIVTRYSPTIGSTKSNEKVHLVESYLEGIECAHIKPQNILLMDDTLKNIQAAADYYQTELVQGSWCEENLQHLEDFLNEVERSQVSKVITAPMVKAHVNVHSFEFLFESKYRGTLGDLIWDNLKEIKATAQKDNLDAEAEKLLDVCLLAAKQLTLYGDEYEMTVKKLAVVKEAYGEQDPAFLCVNKKMEEYKEKIFSATENYINACQALAENEQWQTYLKSKQETNDKALAELPGLHEKLKENIENLEEDMESIQENIDKNNKQIKMIDDFREGKKQSYHQLEGLKKEKDKLYTKINNRNGSMSIFGTIWKAIFSIFPFFYQQSKKDDAELSRCTKEYNENRKARNEDLNVLLGNLINNFNENDHLSDFDKSAYPQFPAHNSKGVNNYLQQKKEEFQKSNTMLNKELTTKTKEKNNPVQQKASLKGVNEQLNKSQEDLEKYKELYAHQKPDEYAQRFCETIDKRCQPAEPGVGTSSSPGLSS